MFKKITITLLALFIVGCGLKSSEQNSKKKEPQVDYMAQGMQHLKDQDVINAIRSFDTAIKEDPENLTNYIVLSQVYYKLNAFDRAVDALTAALRLDPGNGEIYFLISQSLAMQENKLDEAILATQKSVDMFLLQKNEPGVRKAAVQLQALAKIKNDNLAE